MGRISVKFWFRRSLQKLDFIIRKYFCQNFDAVELAQYLASGIGGLNEAEIQNRDSKHSRNFKDKD